MQSFSLFLQAATSFLQKSTTKMGDPFNYSVTPPTLQRAATTPGHDQTFGVSAGATSPGRQLLSARRSSQGSLTSFASTPEILATSSNDADYSLLEPGDPLWSSAGNYRQPDDQMALGNFASNLSLIDFDPHTQHDVVYDSSYIDSEALGRVSSPGGTWSESGANSAGFGTAGVARGATTTVCFFFWVCCLS